MYLSTRARPSLFVVAGILRSFDKNQSREIGFNVLALRLRNSETGPPFKDNSAAYWGFTFIEKFQREKYSLFNPFGVRPYRAWKMAGYRLGGRGKRFLELLGDGEYAGPLRRPVRRCCPADASYK